MAQNFGFRKKRYCAIYVANTKTLISCTVTAQLICAFVFAYAKIRFSHNEAHISGGLIWLITDQNAIILFVFILTKFVTKNKAGKQFK